jgi:hypothetical protein
MRLIPGRAVLNRGWQARRFSEEAPPAFCIGADSKVDKVACFATILQVLILKRLGGKNRTAIV